jgi:hypothetical protein
VLAVKAKHIGESNDFSEDCRQKPCPLIVTERLFEWGKDWADTIIRDFEAFSASPWQIPDE